MRRVPLDRLLGSPGELSGLRDLFAHDGVAAIPTETYYGLAADPRSERGVSRIFEVKGRDDGKPLLVLFGDREQLAEIFVDANDSRMDRFFAIWPAPLTVVVPIRPGLAASRGGETLAIRMPAVPAVRELLRAIGPLTGTSANLSGEPPLADPDEVAKRLGSGLDLVIDGGRTPGGAPSTILDATVEPPRVLREGAFAWPNAR